MSSTPSRFNVPLLVQAGCNVSDLRKLGISPSEIRAAGFTFQQMNVHLGVDRLCEAGYQLSDFLEHHFPLSDLAKKFSLSDLVKCKKFSLHDFRLHYSAEELKAQGFTASEFVQLGPISEAELRRIGFTDQEIAASGVTVFRAPVSSSSSASNKPATSTTRNPLQPPNATAMNVGESWTFKRTGDASTFLDITYTRIDNTTARDFLRRPHPNNHAPSSHRYEGSGKTCPRCGRLFVLIEQYCSSDGMCGVESGTWVCDDANCGMQKRERYEGYGTIF